MAKQAIARQVAENMYAASFIREMFDKGRRMKAEYGAENVYDFSLGNPNASPPAEFFTALEQIAADRQPELHRYMPNAGMEPARAAVAELLSDTYGLDFDPGGIVLTSGAGGAANVALHALLDPGDEVIVVAPYFPEYHFYIQQAQGRMVVVESHADFQLDLDAIDQAINHNTRAVLINTPNNPTGAVYTEDSLAALGKLLAKHDQPDRPLYLLSDDVYARICYDGKCPMPAAHYPRTLVLASFSKDVSIAGERLGYVAVRPNLSQRDQVLGALIMLNRTLGFVNAPALMQRIITQCAKSLCDVGFYRQNRDRLCGALRDLGYEFTEPGGSLFVFPKTPIDDDLEFVSILQRHRILAVPGRGFGRSGHMRLAFSVDYDTIERSLPSFEAAIAEAR